MKINIYSRILKKRGRKCGKGDVKKQNKKRRIKVQNTQLKGDFSHEKGKVNAIYCAISARESSNLATSFVVITVKIFNMNYAYQDITRIIFLIQKMVTLEIIKCVSQKNSFVKFLHILYFRKGHFIE